MQSILKKYPDSVFCAYREAVFSAEENTGYTPAQIKVRHKSAAKDHTIARVLERLSLRKFMQNKARGSFAFVGQKLRKKLGLIFLKKTPIRTIPIISMRQLWDIKAVLTR